MYLNTIVSYVIATYNVHSSSTNVLQKCKNTTYTARNTPLLGKSINPSSFINIILTLVQGPITSSVNSPHMIIYNQTLKLIYKCAAGSPYSGIVGNFLRFNSSSPFTLEFKQHFVYRDYFCLPDTFVYLLIFTVLVWRYWYLS